MTQTLIPLTPSAAHVLHCPAMTCDVDFIHDGHGNTDAQVREHALLSSGQRVLWQAALWFAGFHSTFTLPDLAALDEPSRRAVREAWDMATGVAA